MSARVYRIDFGMLVTVMNLGRFKPHPVHFSMEFGGSETRGGALACDREDHDWQSLWQRPPSRVPTYGSGTDIYYCML